MSSQKNPRLTTRQASAQAQRRAMNERRQKLSHRIRKQKKSDWLAQKRGVGALGSATSTPIGVDPSQSIVAFLRDPPNQGSLQTVYAALQRSASFSTSPSTPCWTLEDPTRREQAKQLVQRIGETLQHALNSKDAIVAILCVQILVQLTSLSSNKSSSTSIENTVEYYGRQAPTWSELLLEDPHISLNLPRLLALPQPSSNAPSEEALKLAEQTCWFLGNWAHDLPAACPVWRREGGLVAPLATLLHLIVTIIEECASNVTSNYVSTIARVVQASSWAFSNLLKGDASASGWDYCQPNLFHPKLASQLMTLSVPPHIASTSTLVSPELEKSCIDISVQAAWIIVRISQREDEVVDLFLQGDPDGTDLFRNVLERLYHVCEGATRQQQQEQQNILPAGQPNYFYHPILEPCLEVLGYWATASNGKHVPRLLSKTPATSRVQHELSLLPLLEQLIRWGQQGLLQTSDYLQLLWLSGCLLCDAGTQLHPSTTLAAPSLIPLLSKGLQDNPSTLNSQSNSLECKREGVLALWNAINAPPSDEPQQRQQQKSPAFQEALLVMLQLILATSNNTTTNNSYPTMMALKTLLRCQDVDALNGCMHILNAILRNIPSTHVTFMEVDGVEALDAVCDLPLGNDQAGTEAADMAAELIDDFFDSDRLDENDEGQFADPVLQPAQAGGAFVFGLDATAQQNAPIFMPTLQPNDVAPMHAPRVSVGSDSVDFGMGRGHGRGGGGQGRGRGHVHSNAVA